MVGPAGEQRLQDAGERALADGDAAGDADDVGHPRRHRAEERRRHPGEVLGRADVEVEQPRQRQVDRRDLVEVDALVDAAQLGEVVLAERQRGRRPQGRPVVTTDREEPAPGLDHTARPYARAVAALQSDPGRSPPARERKRRGAYPTPAVARRRSSSTRPSPAPSPAARSWCVDPACGDGRFLVAAARRVARRSAAGRVLVGVDIDDGQPSPRPPPRWAASEAERRAAPTPSATTGRGAASTSSSATRRTCRSWPRRRRAAAPAATAAGPYADAAVEFLALAVRLARPGGGRIGLVLPQSILASRDAAAGARRGRPAGRHRWSWWSPGRSSTPRSSCARSVAEVGAPAAGERVDRRRARARSACPAVPALADRRHARRPGPADGELPRPVLRARPGRRRRRRRAAARHERADRPGDVRRGASGR